MSTVISLTPSTGRFIAKTDNQKFQFKVMNILKLLGELPKTEVSVIKDSLEISRIFIRNSQEYCPDFKLEYCNRKRQYRVYILVSSSEASKVNAGYCICTIRSALTAMAFAGIVKFLYANRANNKTQAG